MWNFGDKQVPGLAVVIVGHRKDSQSYVSMKRKACAEVGIKSFDIGLPEQVSEAELISKVHELNANPDVHGWVVIYQIILLVTFTAFGFITKLIELINILLLRDPIYLCFVLS